MSNIIEIDGKYYDFGTKNTSFLLTAQELKKLGINNYYFMLEVKHPSIGVQDLDAYEPNISPENAGRIIIECRDNPWFFFREVARVCVGGAGNVPPILTRASCAAVWCFVNSFDFKLCQPRQTHKSTWCTLILEYMFLFSYQHIKIPMLHLEKGRCKESASILRDYICALPNYMNPWSSWQRLPGLESLKYPEHGTEISILSQPKNADDAMNKLRGKTTFGAMLEEYEYLQYFGEVMEGGGPALDSARAIGKEHGIRVCIMMLSTPGNLETEEGKAAKAMIDATPKFNEKLYDLTEKEVLELFEPVEMPDGTKREPINSFYIEFNYKQLRKDDRWLQAQYQRALSVGRIDEYRRGVLLQRYRGADAVLFDQADIDYIQEHVKIPTHTLFLLKKFNMYVYEHQINTPDITSATPYFDINLPYMVGIDVSGGGNGDNTTLIGVNPYTLEIAFEIEEPYIGISDLMRLIAIVAKLMPKAFFCLETNSVGKAVVDLVQESQLVSRFYHDPKLDITANATQGVAQSSVMAAKQKAQQKYYIGTYVTPKVRENMLDLLKRYVKEYKHLLNSKFLVDDILNLERKKNGKIEAAAGCHDDMVMAYLHILYVLHYGSELGRFGVDKKRCTYENALKVVNEYETSVAEDTVNNIITPDQGLVDYQMMRDQIDNPNLAEYTFPGGRDMYGYRHEDYKGVVTPLSQQSMQQNQIPGYEEGLTSAVAANIMSINALFGL